MGKLYHPKLALPAAPPSVYTHADYLFQWEATKWARSKGAEEYNLWGVYRFDEIRIVLYFSYQ